jgi:hypothetical protein
VHAFLGFPFAFVISLAPIIAISELFYMNSDTGTYVISIRSLFLLISLLLWISVDALRFGLFSWDLLQRELLFRTNYYFIILYSVDTKHYAAIHVSNAST